MNDEAKHEVDTEIPTETSQFDQIAAQQVPSSDPALDESMRELAIQLGRYQHLAQALLASKGQAPNVLGESYVTSALGRAEIIVIGKLLEKKLGISPVEYVKAVVDQLDQMLQLKQMEYKILITPDGVVNDD